MRRFLQHVLGATLVTGLAALSLAAATATASITGPCTASLAGVNVADRGTGPTDKPIVVAHDASVPIVLTASSGTLSHIHFTMELAGFSFTVKDKAVSEQTYTGTLPVKTYAKYGVGLYRVSGSGTGAGLSCSGSVLVRVQGGLLSSYAGIAALVVTLLGAGGILAGGFGARGGFKILRAIGSALAGLVAGLGAIVLLQQAAVIYPTQVVAIAALVLGGLLGVAAAALPALGGGGAAKT